MGWHVLGEFLFLLVSAVTVAAVLERLKINAVIGYLLGGMLVGPGVLGLVGSGGDETERYAVMAELGVSLLLFTIGLEITPAKLRLFGIRGGLIGLAQVVVTVPLVMLIIMMIRDMSVPTAFAIGCMVTLSSTAIVARLLADRTELDSPYGRDVLSVLLIQDLAVVPMLIAISFLGVAPSLGLEEAPSIGAVTTGMLIGVGALIIVAIFVLPRLLGSQVFRRNRDFPIILALATALTAAWASHELGLSSELGAFVAGIILARTDFAQQLRADVQVLKSVFLTLFFATVGLLADLGWVFSDYHWVSVIAFCLCGIFIKTVVVAVIVTLSGRKIRTGIRTGLSIAQIGEFSFVVGSMALAHQLLMESGFQMLVSATVLSLLLTPALVTIAKPTGIAVENILGKLGIKNRANELDENTEGITNHIVLAGYGPAGEEAAQTLQLAGITPIVIDLNPNLVAKARSVGIHADIGNSSQREILEHARIASARALIITVPDPNAIIATIQQARTLAPDIYIVARARYRRFTSLFEKAGANHVVAEEGVVGTLLGSMTVSELQPEISEED